VFRAHRAGAPRPRSRARAAAASEMATSLRVGLSASAFRTQVGPAERRQGGRDPPPHPNHRPSVPCRACSALIAPRAPTPSCWPHAFVGRARGRAPRGGRCFAIEYFERLGLSAWSDFPVEALRGGCTCRGELYGFDGPPGSGPRAGCPFLLRLARAGWGDLSAVEGGGARQARAGRIHLGGLSPHSGACAARDSPGALLPSLVPAPRACPRGFRGLTRALLSPTSMRSTKRLRGRVPSGPTRTLTGSPMRHTPRPARAAAQRGAVVAQLHLGAQLLLEVVDVELHVHGWLLEGHVHLVARQPP
jgi:hypothetical protein